MSQNTEAHIAAALAELQQVRDSKGNDYGPAYLRHGLDGLIIRLWDKYARLENLALKKAVSKVKTESVRDTLLDMVNYGLLAIALIDSEKVNAEKELVRTHKNLAHVSSLGTQDAFQVGLTQDPDVR